MSPLQALIALIFISILAVSPVVAGAFDKGPLREIIWEITHGKGTHGGWPRHYAVPGPVAGVGLPALAAAGGYLWLVRRNRRGKKRNGGE